MAISDAHLLQTWREVLALSKLKKGESVTILSSSDTNKQNLEAARNAALDLGGILTVLDLPPANGDIALSRDKTAFIGKTPLDGNKAAMAALKQSDLVIDLMLLLFSPEQAEILGGGTRMLLAVEPPEVLTRLKPTLEDKRRVNAAAAILGTAKTMKITSKAGTNLDCDLGEYPVLKEYGFADEPGRWDHWPSGFLCTWPNEKTARGTIVIDRGDILLPFKSYVQAPIVLTIENGYINKIDGGLRCGLLEILHGLVPRSRGVCDLAHGMGLAAARSVDRVGPLRQGGDAGHGRTRRSTATSSFRRVRIPRRAASATRRAISTFRFAIARCRSMACR